MCILFSCRVWHKNVPLLLLLTWFRGRGKGFRLLMKLVACSVMWSFLRMAWLPITKIRKIEPHDLEGIHGISCRGPGVLGNRIMYILGLCLGQSIKFSPQSCSWLLTRMTTFTDVSLKDILRKRKMLQNRVWFICIRWSEVVFLQKSAFRHYA